MAASDALEDINVVDMNKQELETNLATVERLFAEDGNWFDRGETLPKGQTIEALTSKIWQLYQNSSAVFGTIKTFDEIVNALTPTTINQLQITKGISYDWGKLKDSEVEEVVAGTKLIDET